MLIVGLVIFIMKRKKFQGELLGILLLVIWFQLVILTDTLGSVVGIPFKPNYKFASPW